MAEGKEVHTGPDAEAPHHHPELTTADDGVVLSSEADAELLG